MKLILINYAQANYEKYEKNIKTTKKLVMELKSF